MNTSYSKLLEMDGIPSSHIQIPKESADNADKSPLIVVSPTCLAEARRLNRQIGRQIDFLQAKSAHKTMTQDQLIDACGDRIQDLRDVCAQMDPQNAFGFDDPDDEFAIDCITAWCREFALIVIERNAEKPKIEDGTGQAAMEML